MGTRLLRTSVLAGAAWLLAACGGGGSSSPTAPDVTGEVSLPPPNQDVGVDPGTAEPLAPDLGADETGPEEVAPEIPPPVDTAVEVEVAVDAGPDDEVSGCQGDGECDDGVPCTVDTCTDGACVSLPDDALCDDGNACTDDQCDGLQCASVPAPDGTLCADGLACTAGDQCTAGQCGGVQDLCDDGTACTADSCDEPAGCVHLPQDALCDDSDLCNGDELCLPGEAEGGCGPGLPLDCDDGDDETLDGCDPAFGCQHTFYLPDPVTTVVGEEVQDLVLEWPAGSKVSVEVFPAAFDPGTEVTLDPIGINDISKPLPGILIDGIAFKFLPTAPLKYPVPATITYDYELDQDERYSLMHWNEEKQRFEPAPILGKDKKANSITFSMQEAGEYYLLAVYVEALFLKRLTATQWETKVVVAEWPGLVLGKVSATYDGASCQTGPGDQAGVFVGVLGGTADVQIDTPGAAAAGVHLLEVTFPVMVTSANNPFLQIAYDVVLWQQDVIDEAADADQALVAKWAPIFQFAEGETSFPTGLSTFTSGITQVLTPTGRQYAVSGASEVEDTMAMQGDRGAVTVFDGKSLPQPAGVAEGMVYGRAFEAGGGKVALVYSLYFPYGNVLGPTADVSGLHRGDVRYVVIMLSGADLFPESITLSQHLPGSTVQYLGDEEMPVWTTSSFGGGSLTLGWKEALRCKRSTTEESNEEHPWVFVGAGSHALYPRKGQYSVTLPGGKTQFTETAGGSWMHIWQPPDMVWACTEMSQYNLPAHPAVKGLTSAGENGYLLFSGIFGLSGYARNGLAPYGKAWHSSAAFAAEASTGNFDPGTNCYKCLSASQVLGVDGVAGGVCFATYWPIYICQCSACGVVIGKAFLIFPQGFECKDADYCTKFSQNALCKTGLTVEWFSDVPLNGVVKQNKDNPWQADVMVSVPYPPTCFSSAENTAGSKARVCANEACCFDFYGGVKGVCYPQL